MSKTTPNSSDDGCLLGVDFLNWANTRVGTTCLQCGEPIEYTSLGMAAGQSENRIACGCTVLESRARE